LKAYFLKVAGTDNVGKADGFKMIPLGIKASVIEWKKPQRDEQKNY